MKYKISPTLIIVVAVAALTLCALFVRKHYEDKRLLALELTSSRTIDLTPAQIRSIERIGQWEFLAIADEELVDTVRSRTFQRDDQLVLIYKGTLRLGVDLSRCREGWVEAHGDTVSLTLPAIGLLSEHFIDEARTRSFYESGLWDARTKEAMYRKAARQMRHRCMTAENLKLAEANAQEQLTALFRKFGFRTIEVQFDKAH